jgi:PAS domain S-box-containing protein
MNVDGKVLATRRHNSIEHQTKMDGRFEQATQPSQAALIKASYSHVPISIAMIDTSGRILQVNPAMTALVGYSSDELTGHRIEEFSYAPDRALWPHVMMRLLAGESGPISYGQRLQHKSGTLVQAAISAFLIKENKGFTSYLVCHMKESKEGLPPAFELFDQPGDIFYPHTIPGLGNFEVELQTRTLLCSYELYELFGFEHGSELSLDDFAARLTADDYQSVAAAIKASIRDNTSFSIEYELAEPDGAGRHVHMLGRPIARANGQRYVIGTVQDITQAKRASRRQAALLAIEDAYSHQSDLNEILAQILDIISDELKPSLGCSIFIWNAERQVFDLSISSIKTERMPPKGDELRKSGGAASQIVKTGLPVIETNTLLDPEKHNPAIARLGVQAYAGLPLLADGEVHGVMFLLDAQPKQYDPADIEFAALVSKRAGSAMYRDKLIRQLRSSVQEKEILLKEIHHRVKNNLQLIASLLDLQAGYTEDAVSYDILRDSQNRVRSMALSHEQIYLSHNLAQIDFAAYVENQVTYLSRSYQDPKIVIDWNIQVAPILLNIDLAIPFGLIINELATNAVKHAFPDNDSGTVTISFGQIDDNRLFLEVTDTGVGLPNDFDLSQSQSLGITLVQTLVNQIGGKLSFTKNAGTHSMITVPATKTSDYWNLAEAAQAATTPNTP